MTDLVIDRALADADDLEDAIMNHLGEIEFLAQIRLDFVLEQPFHFHGNARQRINYST